MSQEGAQATLEEPEHVRVKLYVSYMPPECTLPLLVRGPINAVYRKLYDFARGIQEGRVRERTHDAQSLARSLRDVSGGYSLSYPKWIVGYSQHAVAIVRKGAESLEALAHFESLQRAAGRRITGFRISTPRAHILYEQRGKRERRQGKVTIAFFSDLTRPLEDLIQKLDLVEEVAGLEKIRQAYDDYAKEPRMKQIV